MKHESVNLIQYQAGPLLLLVAFLAGACGEGGGKASSAAPPPDAGTVVVADAQVREQGWSMYGFDLANTQSNPTASDLSKASVGKLGAKWKVLIGSGATGTPAVVDGTVYFGGWDGFFYAVDSASGAQRWKAQIGRQFVRSTPLVTSDRVYAAADSSLVALARADGKKLFETPLIDHPQGFIESSPKLADGVIVLGLASFELNLAKSDYTFEGSVVGVDAQSGSLLWRVPVTGQTPGVCMGGSGVSVWSSAAIDPALGLAYIGTGQTYEKPASSCNDSLLAIYYKRDHAGPRIAWKATFTPEDVYVAAGGGLNGLDHDIGGAPNLFRAGDVDAVGVGDKGGTYRAFNRQSGQQLWRADLKSGMLAQLGGVMATAAVNEDTIFVASNTWMAFGFVLNGMHNPADTSTLYALDAKLGSERWSVALDAPVIGSFAVSNGVLFHSTIRGKLYARDAQNGQELWSADTGAPIGSGISLTREAVYVSAGFSLGSPTADGLIFGFALSPASSADFDLREANVKPLTNEECQSALSALRPDPACRSCLCTCNASTTGSCHSGCWEQASCLVQQCGTESFAGVGAGTACYQEHCSSKLLPPNVYQESVRAATCIIQCAGSCGLAPDGGIVDGGVPDSGPVDGGSSDASISLDGAIDAATDGAAPG